MIITHPPGHPATNIESRRIQHAKAINNTYYKWINKQQQDIINKRLGVSYSTRIINLNFHSQSSKFVYGKQYFDYKNSDDIQQQTPKFSPKTIKKQQQRRKSHLTRVVNDTRYPATMTCPKDILRFKSVKRCFLHNEVTKFWKPIRHIDNLHSSHTRFILNATIPYGDRPSENHRIKNPPKFYNFSKERAHDHRRNNNSIAITTVNNTNTSLDNNLQCNTTSSTAIASNSTTPANVAIIPSDPHQKQRQPYLLSNNSVYVDENGKSYFPCSRTSIVPWPRSSIEFTQEFERLTKREKPRKRDKERRSSLPTEHHRYK